MGTIIKNNKEEFLGQIIDIFEDFLEDKGITIDDINNDERIEYNNDGYVEGLSIIFGSDYDRLKNEIEDMLVSWTLI